MRRRSRADLPLREVAAEIAAALRLSDRAVQRRMGEASTTVTDYPDVLASWEHGKIDAAHVAAILDGGTGIDPELRSTYETRVLAAAETETAGRMKSIARIIAARIDPESAARRQAAAKAGRNIRVIDLPDDMARLIADLPATLTYAIYDRLTRMATNVEDAPSHDTVVADGAWLDAETEPSVDEQRTRQAAHEDPVPPRDQPRDRNVVRACDHRPHSRCRWWQTSRGRHSRTSPGHENDGSKTRRPSDRPAAGRGPGGARCGPGRHPR
ncbi:MAG: hypothetical protein DSY74_09005 [Actinobacteria bacterium]|nr:MAG: hypothetical protein DSY74_09005 [Actinomycetota bacterium]